MLQFRLGMDWLCRSTKQGCLSFAPARSRVGPNTCFSTAACATAAAAAAAAAAACFCCGCLCCCCCCCGCCGCTVCWSCSVFFVFSNSYVKAIWWWMLYRTLRKVTCTNMRKKHVRCVGVCSGISCGCVKYVLRVARVDSGWGYLTAVCLKVEKRQL